MLTLSAISYHSFFWSQRCDHKNTVIIHSRSRAIIMTGRTPREFSRWPSRVWKRVKACRIAFSMESHFDHANLFPGENPCFATWRGCATSKHENQLLFQEQRRDLPMHWTLSSTSIRQHSDFWFGVLLTKLLHTKQRN